MTTWTFLTNLEISYKKIIRSKTLEITVNERVKMTTFPEAPRPKGQKTLCRRQQQLDLCHKHMLQPTSNGFVPVTTGLQGCWWWPDLKIPFTDGFDRCWWQPDFKMIPVTTGFHKCWWQPDFKRIPVTTGFQNVRQLQLDLTNNANDNWTCKQGWW